MAKISLRIYNREIESLVDQGRADEVVAHCHHILKTFPKHLETYRLLGKAHLEAKRYLEAVDIFSRVLMAVPEDFIAHVGMSIIRDEQNKLDDAIWHMERAFESQPSNSAIQSELQRLYTRRDGVAPLKIRMTRGALAFMYVQGELYPQAIAEIGLVLKEDPNRSDMRILLARAYYRCGQKADASDLCAQLLKQYPYCFDANRIMMELMPTATVAAESTQDYRTRVIEMDPYATYSKASVFQSNEVPDAAVNLEKLEYEAAEKPMEGSWDSSQGIGLDSGSAVSSSLSSQSDWQAPGTSSDDTFKYPITAGTENDIPDFLRAAGWGESNTPEKQVSIFDQDVAAVDNLVPADLPDWLKGQAPAAEATLQPAPGGSTEQSSDWLIGLDAGQPTTSTTQAADIKDWLGGLDAAQDTQSAPIRSEDIPDWLGGLGELKSPGPSMPAVPAEEESWMRASASPKPPEPVEASDLPDWLHDPKNSAASQPANVPDWLSGLDDQKHSEPDIVQSGDTPSWLTGLDNSNISEPATDAPDWLAELGGKPAAALPADIPVWLTGLDSSEASEPDAAQPAAGPDWMSELGGAKPGGPVAARSADIPDWLTGLDSAKTSEPDATQSAAGPDWMSELGGPNNSEPASAEPANIPDWLAGLDSANTPEPEAAQPAAGPDWMSELGSPKTTEPAAAQLADIPDWLAGLDGTKTSEPEAAQPAAGSDWMDELDSPKTTESAAAQPADIPDWLAGLDSEKTSEPDVAHPADGPDWMAEFEDAKTPGGTVGSVDDVSKWLNDLDAQPAQPIVSAERLGASAQEQDDGVAWLESLAAKHGAKPEELVTDPGMRSETPPAWVTQAQDISQPAVPQPSVENLGTTAQEQDDGVAWLESLAAKHGAKPEELVTDPGKRSGTPPEWVTQARAAAEADSPIAQDIQPDKVESALNIGEQFFADFESTSADIPATDETGMWLRGLDEKEKRDDFITPSADTPKEVPAWMKDLKFLSEQGERQNQPAGDVPQWLAGDREQIEDGKEQPVGQPADIPAWLKGMDEDAPVKDSLDELSQPDHDLSGWLSGLDDEPGLPFDAYPTPNSILADSQPRPNNSVSAPVQEPLGSTSDLPEWLSDVDAAPREDFEEDPWKKSAEADVIAAPEVSLPVEKAAPASQTVEFPDWLQEAKAGSDPVADLDTDTDTERDDSPPWLHRERYEAEGPVQPTPTSPSDWHPVEVIESIPAPMPQEESVLEETRQPIVTPVAKEAPVAKKKTGLSARQSQPEAQNISDLLTQAKSELDRGDIPTALTHYTKLIKKGKHLEESIRDLNESLYRYPVEVGIWQTLGDAYMRSNRLKEALESYNKAEELIR